jgi:hypothetical protein
VKCIVCTHVDTADTAGQTCDPCVSWVRRTLIRIEQLYPLLPYELAGRAGASVPMDPSGIRGDTEPMPGGDVLVMLGPGSSMWHSGHRYHGVTDPDGRRLCQCTADADIDSILGVLERWDRDWRITFGEPAATDQATVTGCSLYLLRRLAKAAQEHRAFDEFADDIRTLHDRTELALRVSPQRSPVPCITCNHRALERPAPRDDGRAFEWQCGRCHRNYTDADYWMAMRQNGQAV